MERTLLFNFPASLPDVRNWQHLGDVAILANVHFARRSFAANRSGKGTPFFGRGAKGSDYLATGTRIADCSADVSPIAHSRQTGVVQAAGQPPPSAINSAAVSERRVASVLTRVTAAVRWVCCALRTAS